MKLEIDSDVAKLAWFMTRTIPTYRLRTVARGLATVADLLWSEYENRPVTNRWGVPFKLLRVEWDGEGDNLIVDELQQLNTKPLGSNQSEPK